MPSIFEIYEWLFKGILWIPIIAILGLILFGVVVALWCALCDAGEIFEKVCEWTVAPVGVVLAFGSPILVPLFIYYAGISESLWFPWLAAISGILGLFVYSVIIYAHFFEKEESSEEVVGKDKHE